MHLKHPPKLEMGNQHWGSKRLPPRYDEGCSPARNRQKEQYTFAQVVDNFGQICAKLMRCLDSFESRMSNLEGRNNSAIVDRLDRLIQINAQACRCSRTYNYTGSNVKEEVTSTGFTPEGEKDSKDLTMQMESNSVSMIVQTQAFEKTETQKSEGIVMELIQPRDSGRTDILTKELASAIAYLTQTPHDRLVSRLKKKMGETYQSLASRLYDEYRMSRISYRDLKMQFAEGVIDMHYELQEEMSLSKEPNLNQLQKVEITAELDKASRNILEFLISKYPPSRCKFIDTEISSKIKEMKKHMDPAYDMLTNAGMKFNGDDTKQDYTYEVKKWVNKMIAETKQQFPKFKETVTQIFLGEDCNNSEMEHAVLEYEVGAKISLTTELYTQEELEEPRLDLKSPELLRILIKWVNELFGILLRPAERILENKFNFKSVVGSPSMSVALTRKRKEKLINKLNSIYYNHVQPDKQIREAYMHRLINDVFVLARAGFKDYDELNSREVSAIKISQYLRECAETYCRKILNNLLQSLNSVRSKYKDGTLESNIDLVTFGVMDLLRCRCVTSKKELFRIYNEVLNRTDYFEIIRVKNKLNESTRDIMINLKIKNSFMICEMQLALGDCKDEINDHFCHNLYELHRSAFPILFETANQLVNLDYRMSFFKGPKHPIVFYMSAEMSRAKEGIEVEADRIHCKMCHAREELTYQVNNIPYCCSHCSAFTNAFSSCLEFLQCPKCMVTICPRCLVETYPTMTQKYLARYINYAAWRSYIRSEPYFVGFCNNPEADEHILKALNESQYVFAFQFDRQGPKIRTLKKYKDQIVPAFYTLQTPEIKVVDSPLNWCILVLPIKTQTLMLSELHYYQKTTIGHMGWPDLDDILEESSIARVVATIHESTKSSLIVDIVESQEAIHKRRTHDENVSRVVSEASKVNAIVELTGRRLKDLVILQYLPNKEALVNLNMWENSLANVAGLEEYPRLQELNLRENQLQSFEGILNLRELQSLNLHQNRLSGAVPVFNMPHLKFLDLSANRLNDFQNLGRSNLPQLKVMIVSFNTARELPRLNLPQLQILYFINNNILNLANLSRSAIPKLRRLQGNNNRIQGELPQLDLPMLEQLLLHDNQLTNIAQLQRCTLDYLDVLNLSNNNIVGPLPVLKLQRLTRLLLQNNSLTSIEQISSWELPSIQTIDIENNLVVGALPAIHLPNLRELHLDNNRIISIHNLESSRLDCLEEISLRNNKLTTLPILRHHNLRHLLLEHNSIESCTSLECWKLPSIESIDLSHNNLMGSVPILFMPNLITLILDHNQLKELKCLQERQLIPNLKDISTEGNQGLKGKPQENTAFLKVMRIAEEEESSITHTNNSEKSP